VHAINVESSGEVERVTGATRAAATCVRVAVRVNPDVDAGSHPYITTGVSGSKFGVPAGRVRELCRAIARTDGLSLVGLHVHVGSQILRLEPLRRAAETVVSLASDLRDDGIQLEHLDVGGGLGIPYEDGTAGIAPADYAAALLPVVTPTGLRLLLEPGRAIVAQAGVLLTRVVDVKRTDSGRRLAVVDAGMTELLRPALYHAYHRIEPVLRRPDAGDRYEVVGPLCETSDTFGEPRSLPPVEVGDVLAIRDVGAYGAVMASNYNRRPLSPEVLVEGEGWRTIRRRQTLDDMTGLED
jgi:diaminopimelate decarboxylase